MDTTLFAALNVLVQRGLVDVVNVAGDDVSYRLASALTPPSLPASYSS